MGGGTGTYQVLSGLKKYSLDISAVISMCDSGGSTGRLRKELGILPPGDIRRAILALSDLPFAQKTLEELFDFRFEKGSTFKGHSVGNLLLAALTQITGSMDKAIEEAARILQSNGNVYPVTLDKTNLVAVLDDGTRVFGETNIDRRRIKPELNIKHVFLNPKARVFNKASLAIENADFVIFGPGDLYTSIIPTLLVEGVVSSLIKSKAEISFVVNLMTKKGETDGFAASDFVFEIIKYLKESRKNLKYIFINREINHSKSVISKWYKKYGCIPVKNDLTGFGRKNKDIKIIEKDFLSKTTFFRHDPEKLAKAITSLF
ncbi:MAG TPA: gluconeogenesis factor YvcK family protein [Patescibacteria group bacterium]|nr:gluconeogenesis factor YvcK family protein [Patescibacteria group bacterium]